MTRARLDMAVDLAWLQEQVPGGSPAQLVDFALQHAVNYVPNPSTRNQRPEDKAWFDESKTKALQLVAEMVPELANECDRQIRELSA